jgi:hypothetical protein
MIKVKIILDELNDDEVWALAQMSKRMTYDDLKRLAANAAEREAMDNAVIKLRRALAAAGIDPR